MFQDYKIHVITPAGRRKHLEVLAPYVFAARPLVDRWTLWVNTPHQADIDHIRGIQRGDPDFVELVYPDQPLEKGKSRPQAQFFRRAIDPGTVYVKLDDDICYVEAGGIEELVRFRLERRNPFLVMANTVMNPTCAYIHQKYGAMDFRIGGEFQRIPPDYANQVWSDPRYAEYIHRTFIDDLLKGDTLKYKFDCWNLDRYERLAINCIAWMGADFAMFRGVIDHVDEELWLCSIKARDLRRPISICGTSLVSHFAYYKHRAPFAAGKEIDRRILEAYAMIAQGANRIRPPISEGAVRRVLDGRTFL